MCHLKVVDLMLRVFSPKVATNETTALHQIICTRIALEQYKKTMVIKLTDTIFS